MTFRELYKCNLNWPAYITLSIIVVDKNGKTVKESELAAYPAQLIFGDYEVLFFNDNMVTICDRP